MLTTIDKQLTSSLAVPLIVQFPKRFYYKHTTKEINSAQGTYRKTTTIVDNDPHTYKIFYPVEPIKLPKHTPPKEIASHNKEIIEAGVTILKIFTKEWQENESFRNWIRGSITTIKTTIKNLLPSKTFTSPFMILENNDKKFIILELPESTKEDNEVRIRRALHLPLNGYIEDHIVLGFTNKPTLLELKQHYFKLIQQWHPDHNTDKELAHLVFLRVKEAYNRLK